MGQQRDCGVGAWPTLVLRGTRGGAATRGRFAGVPVFESYFERNVQMRAHGRRQRIDQRLDTIENNISILKARHSAAVGRLKAADHELHRAVVDGSIAFVG
eukprot:9145838-Alexandrium_andersonii.AAC.1